LFTVFRRIVRLRVIVLISAVLPAARGGGGNRASRRSLEVPAATEARRRGPWGNQGFPHDD
jgi:hypothetical protein